MHVTDRSMVSEEVSKEEGRFLVQYRNLNDECLIPSTTLSRVKVQDGSIVDISTQPNTVANQTRKVQLHL